MENPPLLLSEIQPNKHFQTPKSSTFCVQCKKPAKYQCPRCKVFYCELSCYKVHNPECTEQFYKDQVIQHLKGKKVSASDIKKMNRILSRYQDQKGEDEPDPPIDEKIAEKKLKRLNELKEMLDQGELSIEKLSPEEQLDFARFVEAQKENWKPWKPYWWTEEFIPSLLITEAGNESEETLSKAEKKLKDKRLLIRSRIEKLPELKSLIKNPVNEEVGNHFVNLIYGSCFVLRVYNGDLLRNSEDAMALLLAVSKALLREPRCSFSSVENAVLDAIQSSFSAERETAKEFMGIILQDLAQVFTNKFFGFEILFKIYDMSHALEELSEEVEKKKVCVKIKQKLIFLMSFLKSEVKFSVLEKWRSQVLEYEKAMNDNNSEADKLGYFKKLNLLL